MRSLRKVYKMNPQYEGHACTSVFTCLIYENTERVLIKISIWEFKISSISGELNFSLNPSNVTPALPETFISCL
jgi:hypothetical protein